MINMKKIVKAPAKINLYLRVNEKNIEGYHDLSMVMQTISLYDEIEFSIFNEGNGNSVKLNCNLPYIPTNDKNLIVKVIKYFFEVFDLNSYIEVNLKKNIPTCAGLGGGSSDAASTILFLNEYFKLNIEKTELVKIASKFGADIPFFIYGGEAICEGKGEKITKINPFEDYFIVVATPNVFISTKDIFERYDNIMFDKYKNEDLDKYFNNCIKGITDKNLLLMSKNLFNELEVITTTLCKEINNLKKIMMMNGAYISLMSGSGPTVFGIFESYCKALECKKIISVKYSNSFCTVAKPISIG